MYKYILIQILFISIFFTADALSRDKKFSRESAMVLVKGGTYIPLFRGSGEAKPGKVQSFLMDKYPVTNAEFLEFVKANPQWQRSSVKRIFADKSYLKHWEGDTKPGADIIPQSPVTNVSWFAAKAYAEWCGKRLPTVAEWEYAASAGKTKPNAVNDRENINRILQWYSQRSSKLEKVGSTDKNYWGVYDMFGLIWEWTYDFNSILITGDSRGDSNPAQTVFCGNNAGGDAGNYPAFMRYGFRSSLKANYTVHNLGFRCVKGIKE
jgi:formylglycine-generating enzyme required for sulfatase activity